MKNIFNVLMFLAVMSLAFPAAAGTLDQAPFKITVPAGPWLLIDSTEQDVGQNSFLVATLAETNSTMRSIVIRTGLDGVTASSMTDLLSGIRESLTRPDVKNLAEEDIVFVGIKARHFTYEVVQNGVTVYSDTVVFISGSTGWTVDCVGPVSRQDEVKKMLTYYQKNGH